MSNILLISAIICGAVVFVMINQINKVTQNIDENEGVHPLDAQGEQSPIYARFASFIQDVIRSIKADLDSTKASPYPSYKLLDAQEEESSLEFLADHIRKLVFFESMGVKRKSSKQIESELFEILSSLDEFVKTKLQNGEKLSDELRDKFANEFEKLKRS